MEVTQNGSGRVSFPSIVIEEGTCISIAHFTGIDSTGFSPGDNVIATCICNSIDGDRQIYSTRMRRTFLYKLRRVVEEIIKYRRSMMNYQRQLAPQSYKMIKFNRTLDDEDYPKPSAYLKTKWDDPNFSQELISVIQSPLSTTKKRKLDRI